MFEKRIAIFTGHFGSGKTEVAVNYAFKLANMGRKTAIVDFDIVNPFFRTADARKELEQKGIKVVAPVFANTNVDVPALPPEINTLFDDRTYSVVLDVGGDDLGARVLSRFKTEILADDYIHYFVINTRRPMTKDAAEIKTMLGEIQDSSGIMVDCLVNNTNLLGATTPEVIAEGAGVISGVSTELCLPVGFISGPGDVLKDYAGDPGVERLYLDKYIKLPWE